jgi:flagellar biogenesis protein FliO
MFDMRINGLILNSMLVVTAGIVSGKSAFGNDEGKSVAKSSESAPQSLSTLKSLSIESSNDKTSLHVEFDAPLVTVKPEVEEHGTFLQFQLKNTIVINPGQFVDGSGPFIQKIVAFQTNPKDAAIRLFTDRKSADLSPAIFVDVLENRLLVTLDHKKVTAVDSMAAKVAAVSAEMSKVDGSLPEVNAETQQDPLPDTTTKSSKDALGLQSKMVIATVFCLVLLVMGGVALFFKPAIRKRIHQTQSEVPAFKTLSSHSLGPKQKIAVIKVGDERLLVGITPGSITLLRNLDEKQPSVAAQQHNAFQLPERVRSKEPTQALPDRANRPASTPLPVAPARVVANKGYANVQRAASELQGVEVELRGAQKASQRPTGKGAKPTLPRPVANRAKVGSVDDVTKLIREKLKNLPQAT